MTWPRLSETLPFDRELDTCQACGQWAAEMETWQEHDENDRPEKIFVVLCRSCAERIIGPHERLYRRLNAGEPAPGAMACCVGCRHLSELRCLNQAMKFNGGPGVAIKAKIAGRGFVCTRGKGCRSVTTFSGEPTCEGKES